MRRRRVLNQLLLLEPFSEGSCTFLSYCFVKLLGDFLSSFDSLALLCSSLTLLVAVAVFVAGDDFANGLLVLDQLHLA